MKMKWKKNKTVLPTTLGPFSEEALLMWKRKEGRKRKQRLESNVTRIEKKNQILRQFQRNGHNHLVCEIESPIKQTSDPSIVCHEIPRDAEADDDDDRDTIP